MDLGEPGPFFLIHTIMPVQQAVFRQRRDIISTCQLETAATASWSEKLAEAAFYVNTSF